MHEDYVPAAMTVIPKDGVIIEFPDVGKRDAADNAKDLRVALENAAADAGIVLDVRLEKADPNAQDPGTILAVILGAKATIALATGIALWMRRKNQARLRIRHPDGTDVDISGAESSDLPKIVEMLNRVPQRSPNATGTPKS